MDSEHDPLSSTSSAQLGRSQLNAAAAAAAESQGEGNLKPGPLFGDSVASLNFFPTSGASHPNSSERAKENGKY